MEKIEKHRLEEDRIRIEQGYASFRQRLLERKGLERKKETDGERVTCDRSVGEFNFSCGRVK